MPGLSEKNLDIGAKLNIFGRQVIINAFEDEYTRKKMTNQRQKYVNQIFPIFFNHEDSLATFIKKRS